MRMLLFGASGQLGWELQRALAPLGPVTALDRAACDVGDAEALRQVLRAQAADVIVNASALTAVDRAETERELAFRINAQAPQLMAEEAARRGAWLVHYSTDYVFDGGGERPWTEDDAPAPINAYGESKLAGEQVIQRLMQPAGGRYLILRTSWVYAARGGNFARTMLRLAAERERLNVVADQFGAPTGAELLADVSAHLLRAVRATPARAGGLYHVAAAGETSWFEYARWLLARAADMGWRLRAGADAVTPIATRDYPTPAPRPLNSRLDCRRVQADFDLYLPPWQQGVERMLAELPHPGA